MYEIAAEETHDDGQIIFEEGGSESRLYVIQCGEVEISKKISGRKLVVEVLQPGEIFGELGFISKSALTTTARAIGTTTLGIIDQGFLDKELNTLSAGFRQILHSLVTRLKKASENTNLGRTDPRMPKALSLTFKTKESLLKAYTENVSGSGVFIQTHSPLPRGERLMVNLQLPDIADPIQIDGEVAWSRSETGMAGNRPAGMGIKFMRISRADRQRLKGCLKR